MRSTFRMGFVIVMFDLPTVTTQDRRLASKFRNGLLDKGFLMMQESVYMRSCASFEKVEPTINDVKKIAPERGSIVALYITARQWKEAVNIRLVRERERKRGIDPGTELADQLSFW